MHYYGLIAGKVVASLALVNAAVPAGTSDHAAAWLGASTPRATAWVQAGVELEAGDEHPYLYIETKTLRHQPQLRYWPVAWTHLAKARLQHVGQRWRVRIDAHVSRWVTVPHARRLTVLEMLGAFPAQALIDGRLVTAP